MPAPAVPDLLSASPSLRVDARRVRQALAFAFAHGVPESTWAAFFADAMLPASAWDAGTFGRELFVAELARSFGAITIDGSAYALDAGWIERVLASPPDDAAVVAQRRRILAELDAGEAARRDLERVYALLRALRGRLELTPMRHADGLRRRLEILDALRAAIDGIASGFHGARSELARVRAYGEAIKESEAYAALVRLLDYDDHLATVDVRVRVGADGRVRALALARVRENAENPWVRSPVMRWLSRIVLLVRGYRFDAEEITARLVQHVFDGLEDVLVALVQLIGDIEPYLAALAFRDAAHRAGLRVCLPSLHDDDGAPANGANGGGHVPSRKLAGLFNPLLLPHEKRIVACDLVMSGRAAVTLLTGPNSGGKTRLLQAIGLAQLLGQGGFFVPAASAEILVAHGMFASLGQAPSADASEGRLGTELLRVRALFEVLCEGGVVLLDELCSGTNPSEGEELFRLVLDLLAELRPQAFLSTHFLSLSAALEREVAGGEGSIRFLQVELDADEHPTYRFVDGVARTSLARQTAARLGVTRDDLRRLVHRSKRAAGAAADGQAGAPRSDASRAAISDGVARVDDSSSK